MDLKQAFQQMPMDEKSQELCTINTHLGLFRPKRLPYGVSSSPALWQQTMDRIFNGLPGVFCFVDDILIAVRGVQPGVRYNSDQCDATPLKYPHHLKQHKASEHERVRYSCD